MSLFLFRCLSRAVLKNATSALVRCVPFGDSLYEIAKDFLREVNEGRKSAAERRADLEAVVQADPATIREEARRVAAEAPPAVREPLGQYLEQWPGVVRRSLSRPEDPHGRTAPAALALDRVEDIVPLLPRRPPRFRPGQRVAGVDDWVLRDVLGFGGFAEVWRGENAAGEQAALKFCLEPTSFDALRNEWELLQQLQGEQGIVRLRAQHLSASTPCLIFDYIPGGDLTRLIRCWHESNPQPLTLVRQTLRLVGRLADIVSAAHALSKPIVHRDLKPTNILLQPCAKHAGKETVKVRVSDFGIGGIAAHKALATATSALEAQTTGWIGGHTRNYAAPQQVEGCPPDPRDDVFALGVIGLQTLVGNTTVTPCFSMADDLEERGVPESVIGLVKKSTTENPARRYADAKQLSAAVQEVLAQLPE